MKFSNTIKSGLLSILLVTTNATAGLITGAINADDSYTAYISTDNNTQGTIVSSESSWQVTDTFSYGLNDGEDYFIHISAQDIGGVISAILGEFTLGAGHVFDNGTNNLLTNTINWQVSTTGWSNYSTATSYGLNGASPWGTYYTSAIDSNAQWIWSENGHGGVDSQVYFTAAIKASNVPEPNVLTMLSLLMAGLLARRLSKK